MLRVNEQSFRSDTGRQRTANEDSYFASAPLFVVADGMGGAQAGEVASRIAAESFEEAERTGEAAEAFLRRVTQAANRRIHGLAQHDSTRSGMGTTLTAALVDGDDVAFAHVGDSRAYLWRDGELKLLTSDHSLVEELRRQGKLTPEQAEDHPQRSIITRALGPEENVEVDTFSISGRPGDVFLLCSDGLTTMIKDARIAELLGQEERLDALVRGLVEEANQAGGRDNITVVAFSLEGVADIAPDDPNAQTLIGPSAAEAGMSSDRIRAAAERRASAEQRTGSNGRRRWRTAAKIFAGLLVVGALVVGAYFGMRQVYFLGIDDGGRVTLYRGLPYDLPLGVELYSEVYSIPVQASSVPTERRDSLTNHELRSRSDAVDLLNDLEAAATHPTPATGGTGGTGQNLDNNNTTTTNHTNGGGGQGSNSGQRGTNSGQNKPHNGQGQNAHHHHHNGSGN
jgi:serine/threonine protein phosphatase PrpC